MYSKENLKHVLHHTFQATFSKENERKNKEKPFYLTLYMLNSLECFRTSCTFGCSKIEHQLFFHTSGHTSCYKLFQKLELRIYNPFQDNYNSHTDDDIED